MMNVFISYAREDALLARRLNAALKAAGFDSFFDTEDLKPGHEFNLRIKVAVENADLFIFLASNHSVSPGSYALSELAFAETKWRNPTGYVLPVIIRDFDPGYLPDYLRPLTALQVRGDLAAEVIGWVQERAAKGGDSLPGLQNPNERRLEQFVRSAQPPLLHKAKGSFSFHVGFVFVLLVGIVLIIPGVYGVLSLLPFVERFDPFSFFILLPILLILLGILFIVGAIKWIVIGHKGVINPIAAVVVDVTFISIFSEAVRLQTYRGKMITLQLFPFSSTAQSVKPGDLGWAYIYKTHVFDFLPVSHKTKEATEDGNDLINNR